MSDAAATETTEATQTTEQRDAADDQSPEKLLAALKAERDARRALEREVRPLRTFKQEQEQTRLSADEKLQARERAVTEQESRITARLRASILRDELTTAATAEKLTLQAPIGDVLKLLDADSVDWDGETPRNVRTLLRELVKDRPYLASRRTGSADGGASGDRAPLNMNDLIRSRAGR